MSSQSLSLSSFTFGGSKKFWIGLGIFLWLDFVILNIPATWGAYLMARSGNMAMTGVSGTLWSGSASLASIKIKEVDYSLGQFTWKLTWMSLLTLKPCANIVTDMDNQDFKGLVCVGAKGALKLENATAKFPSALIQPQLPLPVDGQFSLNIEKLAIANNQITGIKGKLTWSEAKVFNGTSWMSLGGFGADFSDDGKFGVKAHVVDVESPASVDLVVSLLFPTGGTVKGNLALTEAFIAESNANAWLSMFATAAGAANAEGKQQYTVDMNL
jgi:general secretion pathway protein N